MERTSETIADIIAEKRRVAEQMRNNLSTVPVRQWDQEAEIKSLEEEADRFDAAYKREKAAIEADALAVGGIVGMANNRTETCAKCREGDIEPRNCEYYGEPNGCNSPIYGEHPSTPNAAAMHSCLLRILAEMIDLGGIERGGKAYFSPDAIADEIRQAFAVPPRNCDRFASAEEAWDAYDEWVESYRAKGETEPFNEFGWLFATATETGGAK